METLNQIKKNAEILNYSAEQEHETQNERIAMRNIKYMVFILGFLCLVSFAYILGENHTKTPQIKIVHDTVFVKSDSILNQDKVILDKLCPVLKTREGFAAHSYIEKGKMYQGYGHKLLKGENFGIITEKKADSLLKSDIRRAYFERQRINQKMLQKEVYEVFIKGKF